MSYSTDLAKILVNITKSSHNPPATLNEGLNVYMIDYARRGVSPRTMFTAFVDLTRFIDDVAFHENNGYPLPLTEVTRQILEAHLARFALGKEIKTTRKPSPYTVERRRRVIKAFIRWMVAEEYMHNNPTEKLSRQPLRERFPSVWSLKDIERFLVTFEKSDIIGHRNYAIAVLALGSGLRAGELAHLRPADIDLKTGTLMVSDKGKTGARTSVMPTTTSKEVYRWLKRREQELRLSSLTPLFPPIGLNGFASTEPMRAASISNIIAKHAKMAGIKGVKLGSHALRHTAASYMARNGASAFEIQRFLGHSSIEMSQRYVAMSNEAVQKSVEQNGVFSQLNKLKEVDITEQNLQETLKRILASR